MPPTDADAAADRLATHLRAPLLALEELLDALTDAPAGGDALAAATAAAREGLGADLAFWYSKGSRALALAAAGDADEVTPEQCAQFARRLLAAVPADPDAFRWVNPDARPEGWPTAACVARNGRAGGAIVVLSFAPGRRFDTGEEEVVRMALKMLVGLRAHAQTATKRLLNGLIHSLTAVLDAKDPYTAGHSERVARIAVLIGRHMGLSDATVGDLFLAGLLHDIGKIGTRDDVLWKAGKLTDLEFEEIKQHPVVGERIVASIEPFRRLCPAVRGHHERYDGTGYPDRLAGEAIPLPARVLGVADALDAMMSPRRYRPARSPTEIDAVFGKETGRQFDPAVVAAFMAIRMQIYPPIFQKGIGESAFHAIDALVDNQTETTLALGAKPK
jgi:HD-GYP domain-containing protein (c-di-GMP phosphodiesterase class II)